MNSTIFEQPKTQEIKESQNKVINYGIRIHTCNGEGIFFLPHPNGEYTKDERFRLKVGDKTYFVQHQIIGVEVGSLPRTVESTLSTQIEYLSELLNNTGDMDEVGFCKGIPALIEQMVHFLRLVESIGLLSPKIIEYHKNTLISEIIQYNSLTGKETFPKDVFNLKLKEEIADNDNLCFIEYI